MLKHHFEILRYPSIVIKSQDNLPHSIQLMFKGPGSDPVSMMEQGSDEKTRTRYLRTDQLHDYQRESSPTPLKLYDATQSKRHIYLTRSRLKQLKDLPSSQCPVHGKLVRRASEDVHERISRHNDTLRNARSFRKMLHTPKSSRSKSRYQLTPKRVTRARRKLLSSGDETKEASKPRRARSRSTSAAVRVRRVTRSQKYRISKPNQNADFIYFPVVRSPAIRKRTKSVPRKQKNEEKDVTRNTGIIQKLKNFASNIKVTLGKKGNPSKGETIDVSNSSHVQNSSDVQWVELNSSKLTNQSTQSVRQSTNQRMDRYVGTIEDDLNVTYQPVSCFGRQKFTISKSSKSLKNKRVPTPYKRKLAKETARMSTPLKPRQLLIWPSITNREKGTGHDAAQTSSIPGCDGAPATMTTKYTQEPNRNAGNSLKQKLPQEIDKCTMTSPQVNVNESGKQTTVSSTMYQSNHTVKVSQAKSHQEMQTCEQSKLSTGVVTNGSLRRCVSDSNAVKLPRNTDASERCMVEVTTKKVMTMGSVQTMTSSKARQPLTVLTTGKGMATTQREVQDSGTFQKSAIIESEIKIAKVQPLSDPVRGGYLSVDEHKKEENASKPSSSVEISQLHSTAIPTPVRVASATPVGRYKDGGTIGTYSSPAAANIEPKATFEQLNHTERVLIKLPSITKPPRRKSCQSPLTTLDVNRDNIATANEMVSPATKSVKTTEEKELTIAKAQIDRTASNKHLQGNKVMADTASKENPKRDLMTVKMTWPQTIPKEIHATTTYSQTGEPHVTVKVIKKDKTTVRGKDMGHVQRPSVAAVLTSSLQKHTKAQQKQGCNGPSGDVPGPKIPVMGKKSSESPPTPESLQRVTKVFDTQNIDDKTLGASAEVEKKERQGEAVEEFKIKESAKPQMSAVKVSTKIVKENTGGLRLTKNNPVQRPFEVLHKTKEKESAIYETMDQNPSESADTDYHDKIPSPPHQNTQRREEKDEKSASEEMPSEHTQIPQLKMKKCDGKVVPEDLSEISPEVTKENDPSKKLEASSSVVSSPASCDTTTESTKKPTMYDASKGVLSGKGKTIKPQAIVSAKPTSAMKNTCEYEKPANPTYVNRQTPHLITSPVQHQTVYFHPFTPAVGLQQAPFLLNSASQNIQPKYLGWNQTFFLAYTPSEFAPYHPDNLTKYQSVQRQDRSWGMSKQQPVYDSPDPVLNQRPYYTSKSKNTMSLVEQVSQSPVASDVTYLRNISHTLTNRNPEPQSININTSKLKVFDLSNNKMTAKKVMEPTSNKPRNQRTECMYDPSKEGITTKNADSSTLPHLTQSDLAELSLLENKDYRPSSGMLDIPPISDYLPDEILDLSDKGSIVRQWEDKQPRNDVPQWENNDKQPRNDQEGQKMLNAQGAKAEGTNKPAIIKSKSEEENTAVSSVGKTIKKMTESCESLNKMSAMKNGKSLCLTIPSITQHRSFLEDKLEEDFSSPSRESSSSSDDLYRSDSQTTSRKRLIESDESEVDERPFADPREKLKPGNSPTGPVSKRQKFEDKIDEMILKNEIILSTGTQMEFEDDYNLRLAKVEQAWTESCAQCREVEKFLDVRPHYFKGRQSFRYVKHLLRMVEYSRTADMVNVYTGKVKDWILQCAIASSEGKPHTLARDLVWRLFTIGELYGKRVASLDPVMIKIVKENVMAVTNCSEIIWQRKCVPFVNSNIQKLFHSKLKEASIRRILDHKCTST